MRYREKLNIVLMRDNGPRSSYRLKRSNFILLALFLGCMPFVAAFFVAQSYILWQENINLRDSLERFETDYQHAEARAERLENLEDLLKLENVQGKELVIRQIAGAGEKEESREEKAAGEENAPEMTEGPGHEEFPAVDTGRVLVGNVQARARPGNSLWIGLDLRNPENEPLLSGEVSVILVTADGGRHPLELAPADVGTFRIARFKRTVMNAQAPRDLSLVNAQIILEVKEQDGKPIYSNIFAIQR